MKAISYLFLLFSCCMVLPATAQDDILDKIQPKEPSFVRRGNEAFKDEAFSEAEVYYKKALTHDANSHRGNFNLGDALFEQERFEDAAQQFDLAANLAEDKLSKARAYHNMGNSYTQLGDFEKAVDAYKNALRNNPKDEDTRYNLAYALQKLKQQQQEQQDKDQENKDEEKQDENEENKEDQEKKDQKEDQEKKEDEQKNDQEQQDEKGESEDQQTPKQGEMKEMKMSKEQIDQILEMLRQEEDKLQEKLQKQKVKGKKVRVEKDW